MSRTHVARQRRQTLYFLGEIRAFSPVFLDTEVDLTEIKAARVRGAGHSTVTHVVQAAAQALYKHPEANAAIRGRINPTLARYPRVNVKVALDKTIEGTRAVLSFVIKDAGSLDLDAIQQQVDHYRHGDPDTMPEFAGIRALQRLPPWLARLAFRAKLRPLSHRDQLLGTVAVTSLAHGPVDSFHSVGGTTITLGIGRTVDRPVVRDGQITVAPVMRLSICFDHRVIDGAESADLLADIKNGLEGPPRNS